MPDHLNTECCTIQLQFTATLTYVHIPGIGRYSKLETDDEESRARGCEEIL